MSAFDNNNTEEALDKEEEKPQQTDDDHEENDDSNEDQWEDEEDEEYENNPNDLDELSEKCNSIFKEKPMWLFNLSFARTDLSDIKLIVEAMGRTKINIGDGLTLLHQAAQFGRVDWIEYLVGEMHHDLEVVTAVGETPLDQAVWRGNFECAFTLIRYGANVDCQTNLGYTPLHRCAYYNHPRLAAILCLAGANQTLCDKENNETAYEVAVTQGNDKIAKLLEPMFDATGKNISGCMYATNNPNHPNFRPEARDALLKLQAMEYMLSQEDAEEEGDEGDDDEEDESGDESDDDDDNMDDGSNVQASDEERGLDN